MDLALLRSFVAVAELGSFTQAARSLQYSQSAVSAHVRRLEHCVGAPLFARGSVVSLTRVGTELLPHARSILAGMERFQPDQSAPGGCPPR